MYKNSQSVYSKFYIFLQISISRNFCSPKNLYLMEFYLGGTFICQISIRKICTRQISLCKNFHSLDQLLFTSHCHGNILMEFIKLFIAKTRVWQIFIVGGIVSARNSHRREILYEIETIDRKNESEGELIVRSNSTWNNIWSTRLIDFLRPVTHIRLLQESQTQRSSIVQGLCWAQLLWNNISGEDSFKKVQAVWLTLTLSLNFLRLNLVIY